MPLTTRGQLEFDVEYPAESGLWWTVVADCRRPVPPPSCNNPSDVNYADPGDDGEFCVTDILWRRSGVWCLFSDETREIIESLAERQWERDG